MTRNHRRVGLGRGGWFGLPLLSGVALFALAGPAAAAGAIEGSGAGVGFSTINVAGGPPSAPLCLGGQAGSSYVINVAAGEVSAAGTTGAAVYAGTLQVTITITAPFKFSPAGVFAATSTNCVGPPAAIPATIAVSGPGPLGTGTGTVSCPADDGHFTRVNTTIAFTEALEAPALDESCTVTTSVPPVPPSSVTVSPVTHEFVGNEFPCFEDPITLVYTCPGALETTHVQGVWTVAGAG